MLNKVVLMGRFTKDPELRSTATGKSVASFAVAVDRDFTGQNGEKETDFINCVAWGSKADFISKYFKKGSMAVVEGRLQIRPYETTDGQKRTAAEVVVNSIYFGESKKDSTPQAEETPAVENYGSDDDLPF